MMSSLGSASIDLHGRKPKESRQQTLLQHTLTLIILDCMKRDGVDAAKIEELSGLARLTIREGLGKRRSNSIKSDKLFELITKLGYEVDITLKKVPSSRAALHHYRFAE